MLGALVVVPAMVYPGTPPGVPPSFDCAIRHAAWQYGKSLIPARGDFGTLYDALQLGACPGLHDQKPAMRDAMKPIDLPLPTDQRVLVVDQSRAPAANSFSTVHAAVEASRVLRRVKGERLTIALREGVHHFTETLQLGPADSGLTLRSFPNESATLSAGVPLATSWTKSKACKNLPDGCWEADLSGQAVGTLAGLRLNGQREIRARFPNFDPELDSVIDGQHLVHDGRMGWISSATEWIEKGAHGMNGVDGAWPPTKPASTYVLGQSVRRWVSKPRPQPKPITHLLGGMWSSSLRGSALGSVAAVF